MSLSQRDVMETRLESLWNGVERTVDVEGILFVRTDKDAVRAEAEGCVLGSPYQLTHDTDPDEFLDWANAKIVNYTGSVGGLDE